MWKNPLRLLAVVFICSCIRVVAADDDVSAWGIASSSSGAKDLAEWMPRVKEAGAGTVRLWPEWGEVQQQGEWRWTKADAILQAAKTNGCA